MTNLDLFVAQARLRDRVIDAWFPMASPDAISALAMYLVSRTKSDLLPMRLYAHQEEMDSLDDTIAMEEWEEIWGFPLPADAEPLTARALVRASKLLVARALEMDKSANSDDNSAE